MTGLRNQVTEMAAALADHVVAIASAAWPRSSASREVERLENNGYTAGTTCDMDFLLSFDDPAATNAAVAAASEAGFTIEDHPETSRDLIVRAPVCLRAYDLSRTTSKLDHLARASGGFAAVIGPSAPGANGAARDARSGRPAHLGARVLPHRRAS